MGPAGDSSSGNTTSASGSTATEPSVQDAQTALNQAGIAPDVVPTFSPTSILDVVYNDPTTNQAIVVEPGKNLTVAQTVNEPQFFLTSNDSSVASKTFLLAFVDPDAPTPQNRSLSDIRHVLAPNLHISGTANRALLVNSTPAITDYLAPGPPPGSGPHRYTVLLFVQPDNFSSAAAGLVDQSTPRTNFNLTTFAQKTGLGDPIAGTFFLTGPAQDASSGGNSTPTPSKGSANGTLSGHLATSDAMDLLLFIVSIGLLLSVEM
ncbi:PEBP-like protein [Artomyces pyxidatus]|uniref:PEBP-like protein n=1 Tax=Artomyces pyxidatus TaxID=48021 RepID=A0ACB8SRK5_9AGAM|nr:PEBP-like protein [Artomyces pyxidatus]